MKKIIIALSILTIAFAGTAFAQVDSSTDMIGIYLADGNLSATAAAGETLELHMIIENMTADSAAGFELKLVAEGPLFILGASVAYPENAINASTTEGEYVVGFGLPVLSIDNSLEIMSFSVVVADDATVGSLFIKPVYYASIAGAPAYLGDVDTAQIIEMRQSTGGADDAVFVVNSVVIPVATETTSFDNLKSLYR